MANKTWWVVYYLTGGGTKNRNYRDLNKAAFLPRYMVYDCPDGKVLDTSAAHEEHGSFWARDNNLQARMATPDEIVNIGRNNKVKTYLEVSARTRIEAYVKLCNRIRPGDSREIIGKDNIFEKAGES